MTESDESLRGDRTKEMPKVRPRSRDHLRLVETAEAPVLPDVIAGPAGRKEVERLTQQLVDALIEIMDLVDDDPEREPNGDEFEDSDGV